MFVSFFGVVDRRVCGERVLEYFPLIAFETVTRYMCSGSRDFDFESILSGFWLPWLGLE